MGIGHTKEARSTNFLLSIGNDRELSFSAQTANVADFTLGETLYMTRYKDLSVPSNKLNSDPLIVDVVLSEDLNEWVESYKWLLTAKNTSNDNRPCDLIVLDSQSQPIITFTYRDAFPIAMSGLQYSVNTENSTVLTFTLTLKYNRFIVTLKDGTIIDEQYPS